MSASAYVCASPSGWVTAAATEAEVRIVAVTQAASGRAGARAWGGVLRLDALHSPDSPVDAGAMYGASDASLTTRLLACLLASSCLCGLQAAGLPIEDCGVSMASCAALRCNIGGLQQTEPMQCTHAKVSREQGQLTHSSLMGHGSMECQSAS
jgi:hypothetical protein